MEREEKRRNVGVGVYYSWSDRVAVLLAQDEQLGSTRPASWRSGTASLDGSSYPTKRTSEVPAKGSR
jgi:hypothetical protein